MTLFSPAPPCAATVDPFSRSSTLTDLNAISQGVCPEPSPQAWLASSKRRTMPSLLDPPGSPLDLLLPIMWKLDDSQWNNRLSLLTHRFLREYGIEREDEIVDKAWKTLELFCVGEEAIKSLQRFKSTFFCRSPPWRELQTRSLALDRSPSWLSFPTFLDESFNLSHSNLSSLSHSSGMDTLTDSYVNPNIQEHGKNRTSPRGSFQSPLTHLDQHTQLGDMAGRVHPRYMTPTAASRAQVSTPEPRASTPAVTSSTGKRKAWMVSAARRVGIVPGTPRSKKEGRVYKRISPRRTANGINGDQSEYQHRNGALSPCPNPPEASTKEVESITTKPKHGTLESSPALPAKDVRERRLPERPSPPDKPLPSLPVATVVTRSPIIQRSLIDAGEKLLRRSISPSAGEMVEEEWPILSPSRPTTPNTLQEIRNRFSNQAEGSTGDRPGSNVGPADCARRVAGRQHGPETTSAGYPPHQQGTQEAASPVQWSSDTMKASLASKTATDGPKPDEGPPPAIPNTREAVPAAASRAFPPADTPTETESAANVSDNNNMKVLSPIAQHAPSSQDSAKVRASRLPKRLSAPGPVRSSYSPRRSGSGRSSPYKSVSSQVCRGALVIHDRPQSSARRPADEAKPQHSSSPIVGSPVAAAGHVPSLIAVKQSSRHGQAECLKSWIPRPRHHFQLHQDAESETEIAISKIPRKKVGSNAITIDHKSDDGDLDTDQEHERKEDKKFGRASQAQIEHKQTGQALENGRADLGLSEKAEELIPSPLVCRHNGETSSSATFHHLEGDSSSTAASTSIAGIPLDASRQRQLIDKPYNRVKRLSAIAPDHGPILRISDSADKIIMGYGSEEDLNEADTPARKRNSVPDLRRSVAIKELRKSTEGLLNGRVPLSRSSTTRSLTRFESKEQIDDRSNVRGLSDFQHEPRSVTIRQKPSASEDPFSSRNGNTAVNTDGLARKHSPDGLLDWPLRPTPQHLTELHPVEEDSLQEGQSWIPPLATPGTATVSERKLSSPITNDLESRPKVEDASGSIRKRSQAQIYPRPGGADANLVAMGTKPMPGSCNGVRSALQQNAQFPPRTSSRANTPDVLSGPRPQMRPPSSDIPNRFESAHPRRISDDFSLPKSATFNPETLRHSIHKLKDTEKSKITTPITRETGKTQLSSAKGMLSNIKGLFHKRSTETPNASSTVKSRVFGPGERSAMVTINGSPYPNYHLRTLPAASAVNRGARLGALVVPTPKDAFPPAATSKQPQSSGLDPDDYRQAADLAMRVLDAARIEHDPLKRTRLLQLGQLMVEAVNGARDAEKAMEEAKQAAARAKMHCMRTKKSVMELTRLVGKELEEN